MARNIYLKLLRTTRANLDAQATAVNILQGEPYFITDESRFAIGVSTSTYQTFLKVGESSSTPAGATTQIQYNNAGVFAASSNLTYDAATNTLSLLGTNPKLVLNSITAEPAVPAAGTVVLYAKTIAGRTRPKWVDPYGIDTPIQQALMFNRISTIRPASAATQSVIGMAVTNVGTLSTPALASTNLLTSTKRTLFTGAATAGTLLSQRGNDLDFWRGNAAGLGGFDFNERFGLATQAAGNRAFFGISDSIVSPTNIDPTTSTTPGKIGLAINTNTGNWNLVNNVTGTAPTVLALGASFPVNTTDLMELALSTAPNGSSVGYRVKNMSTGAEVSGTLTTNIPANATFLTPWKFMTNNATAAAFAFASICVTIEGDQ